jgi:hypothetical protein
MSALSEAHAAWREGRVCAADALELGASPLRGATVRGTARQEDPRRVRSARMSG